MKEILDLIQAVGIPGAVAGNIVVVYMFIRYITDRDEQDRKRSNDCTEALGENTREIQIMREVVCQIHQQYDQRRHEGGK